VAHPGSPSGPLCHPTCVVTVANEDCGPPKNGITESCYFFSDPKAPNPDMLCVIPVAVPKQVGQRCLTGFPNPPECAPGLHCVNPDGLTTYCRYFCQTDNDCTGYKKDSTCELVKAGVGFCRI
jgi:hypothetical protein